MVNEPPIGIIGLGLVGKALARRFLDSGYAVAGYDIAVEACEAARRMGVAVEPDPRDVAKQCDVILLSLPNPGAIREVLWGDRGIASALSPGALALDTSTTDPDETIFHHQRLKELGVRFIDACLVGSSEAVIRGEAVILVGDRETNADYLPVLRVISNTFCFLGGPGGGNRAKLAVNLVLGLNRLVLAEGLTFGAKSGIDPAQLLGILKSSAAYSRVMDSKGDRMLRGEFAPAARLIQHAKDVDLILASAERHHAKVPVSRLHASILSAAIAAGWGDLDNSAIIKAYTEEQ